NDGLENRIRLDIQAESYAIDNRKRGRKKSQRRTEEIIDNETQNVDHQFIEVTPEEILSQNRSQLSAGPNVTTRSRSALRNNSKRGSKRGGLKRGSNRKTN